uniref:Uncharacterized protein n=1 Tax=Rhizophora mucronata TaxID=61149 RepID=A0A2P2Q1H1_RHIMU
MPSKMMERQRNGAISVTYSTISWSLLYAYPNTYRQQKSVMLTIIASVSDTTSTTRTTA